MPVSDYVFWTAVILMAAASLYLGPRIRSNRVAMQWGLDGKPTWYAPKALGLWGLVAFALAVRWLIWALATYAPDRVHGADVAVLLFSVIVAAAHLFTLRTAARNG